MVLVMAAFAGAHQDRLVQLAQVHPLVSWDAVEGSRAGDVGAGCGAQQRQRAAHAEPGSSDLGRAFRLEESSSLGDLLHGKPPVQGTHVVAGLLLVDCGAVAVRKRARGPALMGLTMPWDNRAHTRRERTTDGALVQVRHQDAVAGSSHLGGVALHLQVRGGRGAQCQRRWQSL